jgi:hypothetical protein
MTDINVNALSEAINDKLDRDMDNLLVESTESKNIANWSNNVTNCITEIPQDIKLELNDGTLTLKAGSKVYVPNGFDGNNNPQFNIYTVPSDITKTTTSNTTWFVFVNHNGNLDILNKVYSGSSAPSGFDNYAVWYDTANNVVKQTSNAGSTWTSGWAFPVGIVTSINDSLSSIDQVFNGFGYIGSTIFALPGVKGLIPNGRNNDGTLKNISFTSTNVITSPINNYTLGSIDYVFTGADLIPYDTAHYWYKEEENKNFQNYANAYVYATPICHCSLTSGVVSNFIPKTVYYPVDYSGADFVIAYQRPTSTNNYTWYRLYKSGWVEQGGLIPVGASGWQSAKQITLPVTMANTKYVVNWTNGYTGYIDHDSVVQTRTVSSFTISQYTSYQSEASWEVKGFAA